MAGVSGFAALVGNKLLGTRTVPISSSTLNTCAGLVFGRNWVSSITALYFFFYTRGGNRIFMFPLNNTNDGIITATITDDKTINFNSSNLDEIFSVKFE